MRPIRLCFVAAALLALLLTGCGVAGTQFHPGVAAQVGDIAITNRHVDQLAAGYCKANEKQIQPGSRVPLHYLRSGIAGQLALVAAVQQLADSEGVTPGTQYRSSMAQLRSQVASLDKDAADAVVEVESGSAYIGDVLSQVGGVELSKQGTANADSSAKQKAGQQALAAWIDAHTVDINPSYGVSIAGGTVSLADTDISYPKDDAAKGGLAASPDAAYAAGLPGSQACGSAG